MPNAVSVSVDTNSNIARSGDKFLRFRTSQDGGSIAQDFLHPDGGTNPSVSAFAFVRSGGPTRVTGSFTLWDLDTGRNISTPINVGRNWVLLINTLGMPGGQGPCRIEFYLGTVNVDLLLDSVNAF